MTKISTTRFEERFCNRFRIDLPPPLTSSWTGKPLRHGKHFSEKFWKRRPSFKLVAKNTLKLKPRFFMKDQDDEPTSFKSEENEDDKKVPTPHTIPSPVSVFSPSPSVVSLPSLSANSPLNLSPNIDQCLPLSTSFSVLTISREHSAKLPGEDSMNTFRELSTLQPERFKKLSYSAPPKKTLSELGMRLKNKVNENSRINSSVSCSFSNNEVNFYGVDYQNIPRTDFSFRIPPNSRIIPPFIKDSDLTGKEDVTLDRETSSNFITKTDKKSFSKRNTISFEKKVATETFETPSPRENLGRQDFTQKVQLLENTFSKTTPTSSKDLPKKATEEGRITSTPKTPTISKIYQNKRTLASVNCTKEINNNTVKQGCHLEYRRRSCSESYAANLSRERSDQSPTSCYRFSVKDLVAKFDCGECSKKFHSIADTQLKVKNILV